MQATRSERCAVSDEVETITAYAKEMKTSEPMETIDELEQRMKQRTNEEELFTVCWRVV